MADEIIFELLHSEIVGQLYSSTSKEDQVRVLNKKIINIFSIKDSGITIITLKNKPYCH